MYQITVLKVAKRAPSHGPHVGGWATCSFVAYPSMTHTFMVKENCLIYSAGNNLTISFCKVIDTHDSLSSK